MKTLKDLKLNANKFKWSLVKNSWYQDVPDFQKTPRKVGSVGDFSESERSILAALINDLRKWAKECNT